MSESDLRGEFCRLAAPLDPWPIENMLTAGTPDVNILSGWCELKWAREFPVRESTVLRLDHYTDIQRSRLLQRWNAGGGAWLLLQVKSHWFVFEAPAAQEVGRLNRADLVQRATHYSPKKPSSELLCSWLHR